MSPSELVVSLSYVVLAYFLVANSVYLALYAISFVEVSRYVRKESFWGLSDLFASNYAPPVSVIVPAYNEQATIADSVRSFLSLHYPRHEVIVVNDGSTDQTLEILRTEFDLYDSVQPVRRQLQTAPIRGVLTSPSQQLVVLDKDNGGKADALNAGVCAARYPLVCCLDADMILEEEALLRVVRPMVESSDVVAVGGIVRVANGCEFAAGRLVRAGTPSRLLPSFQVVEYLRAFITTRTAWSRLNCLLIISGAFGLFRRQDLVAAGGYATDSVGEDMELATRMHRTLRETNRRYRISFVPDPVAWTEAPETLRVLGRQRDRWHRGLIDSLSRHRRMLLNPRYGTVGMVAMPYFVLFELLGPVLELVGYGALVAGLFMGALDPQFAVVFLVAAVGLGTLLSVAAVFLEELRLAKYTHWRDLAKLLACSVLENLGYRQLTTLWRVTAIVSYLRDNRDWGVMERRGFAPEPVGTPTHRG
jgi:cellulose synthase/poly-beta-1,6-N-acetylglucosamine synthase-like glycosyltransferase